MDSALVVLDEWSSYIGSHLNRFDCILHLNISSISAHINNLRNFLNLANQKTDIICISGVEF